MYATGITTTGTTKISFTNVSWKICLKI
jgi:hypothetical protein